MGWRECLLDREVAVTCPLPDGWGEGEVSFRGGWG